MDHQFILTSGNEKESEIERKKEINKKTENNFDHNDESNNLQITSRSYGIII